MNRKPSRLENPMAAAVPDRIRQAAAAWKTRVDSGLSPAEETAWHAWLEADPRHRAAYTRFDAVWGKLDRPFQAGVADELLDEVKARIGRRRRVVSAVAGLTLLLTLGGAVVWRYSADPEALVAARGAADGAAETSAVLRLPARQSLVDGSLVELKAGAEMTTDFSPTMRRVVLLRGEAHFQVVRDPARPFVVAAGEVEARAVGTAFSVQVRPEAVEVLVTEGHVAVEQPPVASSLSSPEPAATPEPLAMLAGGHGVVVQRAQASFTRPEVMAVPPEELDERLAWRVPRVEFTRTTLAEAVALLNEHAAERHGSGRRRPHFVIADPALVGVRVSGLFRVDRTEAFVSLLHTGFGITAEPRGDGEIVLRRVEAPQL